MTALKLTQVNALPSTSEKGKIYFTSDGRQYIGKTEGFLEITNIEFQDALPENPVEGKLYVLQGNGSLTIYSYKDGELNEITAEVVEASLTVKGIVQLTNEINEREDIAVTPKAVLDYLKDFKGSLKKEEIIFESVPKGTTQLDFTPTIVGENFIDFLFTNTVKAKGDTYSIAPKDPLDLTKGYILTLDTPTPSNSTMINLVLVSGVGGGGNENNGTEFKGIGDSQTREMVEKDTLIIPINEPSYTPDKCTILLFHNTTKVFADEYSIQPSTTSASKYEIVFNRSITEIESVLFEVVVIYGKSSTFIFGQ